jgi:hypothetical protein
MNGRASAPIDGEMPVITVTRTDAITSGTWRKEAKPKKVFAGVSDVTGDLNQPVELEIYRGNSGVLRTVYKWVPVTNFRSSAKALRFDIDTSADVKPSLLDRDIVRRAAAMLSSDAVWNRHDNRKCPKDAATHSIYCAMIDASIAVTGGFNHRRPAMEAVRAIVDERSAGRPYHHRLMDYNNDPKTTLGDVQSLFAEALRRMK